MKTNGLFASDDGGIAVSINRIVMWLVVAAYVVVNVLMEINFFSGRDIFAKYKETSTAVDGLRVAQEAYFAKTGFLLLLLILLVFRVRFALAFALSLSAYVIMMVVFFGITLMTGLYLIGAIILLASYFFETRQKSAAHRPV